MAKTMMEEISRRISTQSPKQSPIQTRYSKISGVYLFIDALFKIHPVHRNTEFSHIQIISQFRRSDRVRQDKCQHIFFFQHILRQVHTIFAAFIFRDFKGPQSLIVNSKSLMRSRVKITVAALPSVQRNSVSEMLQPYQRNLCVSTFANSIRPV